jgi:hypothetical protein
MYPQKQGDGLKGAHLKRLVSPFRATKGFLSQMATQAPSGCSFYSAWTGSFYTLWFLLIWRDTRMIKVNVLVSFLITVTEYLA